MPLKKYSIPKSWKINKRDETWVTSPKSPHKKEKTIPINVLLRDVIGLVENTREVKRIQANEDLEVDKRKIKDHKFGVGLFDVISIPQSSFHVRTTVDKKGRLKFIEIGEEESNYKICKVENKRNISEGKYQLNLHDGRNIIKEEADKISPLDSLLIKLPDQEIEEVIKFKKGNQALVTAGKHSGKVAEIKDKEIIKGPTPNKVLLEDTEEEFSTIEEYVTVVGKKEPEVTVNE